MRKGYILIVLITFSLLSACNQENISSEINVQDKMKNSNFIVKEIINENPEADIFIINNIVYINADEFDWVNNLDLEIGNVKTTIDMQSKKIYTDMDKVWATKLPEGTKIYKPKDYRGPIYIAKVEGNEFRYISFLP